MQKKKRKKKHSEKGWTTSCFHTQYHLESLDGKEQLHLSKQIQKQNLDVEEHYFSLAFMYVSHLCNKISNSERRLGHITSLMELKTKVQDQSNIFFRTRNSV